MDQQHQQLINQDGIHSDILSNPDGFTKCSICTGVFDQASPPDLLKCGHLICNKCRTEVKICGFCNTNAVLKVLGYRGLLQPVVINEKLTFRVTNVRTSQKGKLIQNVTMSSTIKEIVEKCQVATSYFQMVAQTNQYFQLNGKSISYALNKNTKLSGLKANGRQVPIYVNQCNSIIVHDRSIGGNGDDYTQ